MSSALLCSSCTDEHKPIWMHAEEREEMSKVSDLRIAQPHNWDGAWGEGEFWGLEYLLFATGRSCLWCVYNKEQILHLVLASSGNRHESEAPSGSL